MQSSLFYILQANNATLVITMLLMMMVALVVGVDLDQDKACKELNYVDSQLKIINPEAAESSRKILDMLVKVDSNTCTAEKRPSNYAFYRQLYNAYTREHRCETQEFKQLSSLRETAERNMSILKPYVDDQLENLFKLCMSQINLSVSLEEARFNETYPVDSILLEQLTDSVYSMAPFVTSYGRISSSNLQSAFLQNFIVSTGLAESDREIELIKIQVICMEYETVMAKSYVKLAQFHGGQTEFEQLNTITRNAVKKVKVCEQAKALTSLSV